MANPYNGSRSGKRGTNNGGRPSRKPFIEPKHRQSSAAVFAERVAPYWEPADIEETTETHVVPRQSLTRKEHLKHFPQTVEFESMKPTRRVQQDKNGNLVETTDPRARVSWKSDHSLLRLGKPDNFGEDQGTTFIRETSRSKQRRVETEIKPNPEANDFDVTGRRRSDISEFMEDLFNDQVLQKFK